MSQDLFNRYARGNQDTYTSAPTNPIRNQTTTNYSSGSSSIQQSSSISVVSNQTNNNSQVINQISQNSRIEAQSAELDGEYSAFLKYASELNNGVIVSGSSDYSRISTLRNAILELKSNYFNPNTGLSIRGENRDELDRRFLLIEHELDGLLRRRIEYSTRDVEGGARNLDFTNLINEKENQIVELEKKIQNLEDRLRRATAREIELENKIVALKAENFTLRDKSYTGQKLEEALKRQARYEQALKDLQLYKSNFATAASIWKNQLTKLSAKYSNDRFDFEGDITNILQRAGVQTYVINGFTTVEVRSDKTVEVPVQDARTKHLIHLLATNLKTLSGKYPKLLNELDKQLVEFFQQQLIDVIEVDELDRIVEIVKFVPQAVRVQNVYAYSSSKSRRVEFHLRVLIKALLEELQKLRAKYGAVLDIDEGIIGMINQQILGVVNVDDILKVFRVVPKIVQVEKIIEKIVERIVEVPQVIPIEKYVEKIIEVPKIVEVEKVIHVPVQVIKIVDNIVQKFVEVPTFAQKIVEVPTIKEKIVQMRVQVPKVVEVEKIVEKIVVNTEVVEVKVPVHHVVNQIKEVERVVQKAIPIQRVVQKIVEVPVYVEKIVQKVIQVPKIIEVELIKQKIVKVIEYQVVSESQVAIKEVIKEVPIYIQKIVPVQTVVQTFIEVVKVIEKPVPLRSVETIIKEIQVIKEKLVPVVQIKEVQKIRNVVVQKIKQVQKIIDRKVQIPVIQEQIVRVPQQITIVVIEKVHVPQIIPVKQFQQKIVYETKIVEVEKPIIQYIKDIQVVKCVVQKIVEVPRTVQRIKEVKVRIQKIVQKLVQVPKVVEVEKIVQKVVVVPRVIEKIVEVPQIVEVIVQKIIEKETVRQVQVIVQKIVEVEKPVEVQKVKNVYINIEKPVQKIVERIVPVQKIVQKKEVIDRPVQKIVALRNEVPKEIIVQKIVTKILEKEKIVQIEKPCTLVVEVPVEVEKIIEKPVKVVEYQEKLVNAVEVIEKPVPAYVEKTKIVQVQKIVEKLVEVARPKVVSENKIIIQDKIKEVPTIIQKAVVSHQVHKQPFTVTQVIEKIVEKLVEIPKIISVECIVQKFVEKIQIVELETILPQLIKINEVVDRLVQKIVPVYYKQEVAVATPVIEQKIIQVAVTKVEKEPVDRIREKVTEVKKMVEANNVVNHIEKEIQLIDRVQKTEVPVYTTVERIVEVPQILEKIVERIVIMPQVVEVLKYVHEIAETQDLGIALGIDIQQQQLRYKEIYGVTKKQLEVLLVEIRKLRISQPALAVHIDLLQKYLIDFDRLAAVQRIVAVDKERIVQKDVHRAVLVPTKDSDSLRSELALSLLVEKLILEVKRIKKENPNISLKLDEDVGLIFFTQLYDKQNIQIGADFSASLKQYTSAAINKLKTVGGNWTTDHELIFNTILQERFAMANLVKQANLEIEKVRTISDKRAAAYKERENLFLQTSKTLTESHKALTELLANNSSLKSNQVISRLYENLNNWTLVSSSSSSFKIEEPLRILGQFVGSGNDWNRVSSLLREREAQISLLKTRIYDIEKSHIKTEYSGVDNERTLQNLRIQNDRLIKEIDRLKSSTSVANNSATLTKDLEMKLKTANSRIKELESQVRTYELQIKQLNETKASVASTSIVGDNSNLVSSQYSASSSTSSQAYGTSSANITKTEIPSYGNSSNYSIDNLISSGSSGSKGTTFGTTAYGQSGTAYQAASKLNTSGITSANSSSIGTYGTKDITTGYTANSGNTGAVGSATYGDRSFFSNYANSGLNAGGYGATGTIGITGGTTGVSGSSSSSSSLSSSGLRSSGMTGSFGSSSGTSGYTFQTKKY